MLRAMMYRGLNALPLAAYRQSASKFEAALRDPEDAQRRVLSELIRRNKGCAYGQRYEFSSIRSAEDYQRRIPVVAYDDVTAWVERAKCGERNVLTSGPVVMFEKSSGSASAAKYIPYTAGLRTEFQAALGPWITDLHLSFPQVASGPAYWLVTPLSREREFTTGGIPVGFESDAEYFGPVHRWLLRNILAVPDALARVNELEDCLYLTMRFLLQARSLTFISVWSPSFLPILLNQMELHGERLVRDLYEGQASLAGALPEGVTSALRRDATQAENLRAMLRRGRIEPGVLWPRLQLISCWTAAASAPLKKELVRAFPGVAIQGKGLLATEGVVSIPLETYQGCVAAITSHFLEFLEPDSGECRLVSGVEQGREYSVVLTTGGGLWRYQLGDRVRVTGFAERTPILEFVGKEDCVTDLRGEKLNALFVAKVFSELESCRSARFAMLAPSSDEARYTLFLEGPRCQRDLATQIDGKLRENPHYAYCRKLGQLGEIRVFHIERNAIETYLKHCETLGQRAGNVKMTVLHKKTGWETVFTQQGAPQTQAEVCA